MLQGGANRLHQVALVQFADQVDEHLTVGLGLEHMALGLQLALDRGIILDDAVMDHRQPARLVGVGMGIFRRWTAVCRPTGMGDPQGRLGAEPLIPPAIHHLLKVTHLPALLDCMELAALDHHKPRRVIPAVFQPY